MKSKSEAAALARFRRIVFSHYAKEGRHHLPWRKTRDPYRILVSEVMLQQTQVDRVLSYFHAWMKQFPTVHTLARAPLSEVLRAWQGLGYNRRGKALHEAAKEIVRKKRFPKTLEELEALPGVGPYTARAVLAFAYNEDVAFVETNVRTVVMHHFFKNRKKVDDKDVLELLLKVLPKGKAREWYSALMDYGAHLKRSGIRINSKAKGYTKQSTFRGSSREARGAILKALAKNSQTEAYLLGILGDDRKGQMRIQIEKLLNEKLIEKKKGMFQLPA